MSDPYSTSASDLPAIREIAEKHGFCLIKAAFTPLQMAALSDDLAATHEAFAGAVPDLLSCPRLRWLLFDERICSIARYLMGHELVYYGETNVSYEPTIGDLAYKTYNTLHIDAVGRPDSLLKVWKGEKGQIFRDYRFAIYQQNYRERSGGLKVVVGTHLAEPEYFAEVSRSNVVQTLETPRGKIRFQESVAPFYNVPSEPGDLVVWNLRTMHAARAQRLVGQPNLALSPTNEDLLAAHAPDAFLPQAGPRNAVFFDLGTPTEEVDLYIKQRSRIPFSMDSRFDTWTYDSAEAARLAAEGGMRLRFDKLLVALAVRLAFKDDPKTATRLQLAPDEIAPEQWRERIIEMALRHEEYSSHFPLFPLAKLRAAAQADRVAATKRLAAVIVRTVAASKKMKI